MMKRTFQLMFAVLFMAFSITSCKPKDEDIQKGVTEAVKAVSGVSAEVKDGVVTLTGAVADDAAKAAAETAAKAVKGVKSVTNSLTVTPPPSAPVVNADDVLTKAVADAVKDFPSVKAAVKDGVVTVTGELNALKWKTLKMALDALKPKKVDATGLKVK